jgi:hypothetical protein
MSRGGGSRLIKFKGAFIMRTLIENDVYKQNIRQLGGARKLNSILEVLTTSIAERPEVFPIIPGFTHIRMAKTDKVPWKPAIKRLKIGFRILSENEVELLWISEFEDEAEA